MAALAASRLPRVARVANAADWDGFRAVARALLVAGIPPHDVVWHTHGQGNADLLASSAAGAEDAAESPGTTPAARPALLLPRPLLDMCAKAALHREENRWALIYRFLWRLQHEPALRSDPLDADRMRLSAMARAVDRDMHRMKAFVRFRPLASAHAGGTDPTERHPPDREAAGCARATLHESPPAPAARAPGGAGVPPEASLEEANQAMHVAWFEPEHHIVAAVAPFFTRRFAQMRWAILTPDLCVRWDGQSLQQSPGATASAAPGPDAGEALWLTYYRGIFNPARLKLHTLRQEMPRRYWPNLPEAALIHELAARAPARCGRMIEASPTTPARRVVTLAPRAAAHTNIATAGRHVQDSARPATACVGALPPDPLAAQDALRTAVQHCRACPIGQHATQAVWGVGPLGARLMVVGEQPGDREDLLGSPFVGPAGQLFDRALADLGWARDQLYLTNAVKHFKYELRGKRRLHKTASQREAAACLQWLDAEIELVRPRALLALGATAARALAGRAMPVQAQRGRWLQTARGLPLLVVQHPSALLRLDPSRQATAYRAWLRDLAIAAPDAYCHAR